MDPITVDSILAQLPEIQRRNRRVARLRGEAARGETMMMADQPLGNVSQTQSGGLYQTVGHYIPNYAGQMQKAVGAMTNYNLSNRADEEDAQLDQMRDPEIINSLQQYGSTNLPAGAATKNVLRGYLGMLGGPSVKDLGITDSKVRSTQKLANGNLGLVTDEGIQDTGIPFDYGVDYQVDSEGNVHALGKSGAGRAKDIPVGGAAPAPGGAGPVPGTPGGPPGVNIEGVDPGVQRQIQTMASAMQAAGLPQEEIDKQVGLAVARATANPNQIQGPMKVEGVDGAAQAPVPAAPPAAPAPVPGRLHVATAGDKKTQEINAANALAPQTAQAEGLSEAAKLQAKNAADARANLPALESAATAAISDVDKLYNHPGLKDIVGNKIAAATDQFPLAAKLYNTVMAGTPQADALALHNAAKSNVFLKAYQLLKGGGSITEVEGQKAESAMGRLDRAQSYDAYRAALKDFRDAVTEGLKKMRAQAASSPAPSAAPAAASARPALPAGFSWGD